MRCPEGRLREERGLSGAEPGRRLAALAREVGFDRAGFVDPARLAPWAERWRSRPWSAAARGLEAEWILSPGAWSKTSSILVCCLSCYRREPGDLSTPGDPHGLVAPFARANYYRAAAVMLRAFASRCDRELGIPRRSIRIFTNSRIPEKPLLAAAGLGAMGKNGLCLVPGLGSLFVIAGAVLPVPTAPAPADGPAVMPDPCGGCEKCLRACPAAALIAPGVLDPRRCLQARATSLDPFDDATMEMWGARLYGCQDCQSCCPHNGCLGETARAAVGEIGPSIPLLPILSTEESRLRKLFHGTALGMSWIPVSSLVRNALVAAGARRDPVLRGAVTAHAGGNDPSLRRAAGWALERLSGGPTCVPE